MPCSARMGLHWFRISAWGVMLAPTFRVTVSPVEAEPEVEEPEAAGVLLLPQPASRLRARTELRARARNFFIVFFSFSNMVF